MNPGISRRVPASSKLPGRIVLGKREARSALLWCIAPRRKARSQVYLLCDWFSGCFPVAAGVALGEIARKVAPRGVHCPANPKTEQGETAIMTARPQLPDRAPRAKGTPTALDGLLVVDFTRVVAGPACTQTLADFGAEVIKIENPEGGDDTRAYEHAELAGESAAYISLNRGKRGIALDLATPEGCAVARELIAKADVVVENFSASIMKKYGLDYASVAPGNPRLVYCSISAYGRQGPFASRPGFDPITQAESGFMSLNGLPDGPPTRTGPPTVDMLTGMSACNAILLALLARDRLGRGQQVEVALFDTAVAMTQFYGMAYLMTGVNPSRQGNSPNGSPSVGLYQASDGPFYIACANDRLYRRLVVEVLERPDLASGDFADRRSRSVHKDRLRAILTGIFASEVSDHWVTRMKAANIPVGFLRTVEEAFNSGEVRARHRVSQIPHPAAGFVPNIETPLRLELTPAIDPVAAPLLGQHTKEVLRKTLGYDDARLAALAAAGVFGKVGNKG
jgi:crotonobetainyl-CoA:carnitine CoA-transferase CaiB-like acyl-CoA transferase